MAARAMYLVRNEKGQMFTLLAQSTRGAIRDYVSRYRTRPGEELEVKERGAGEWEAYRIGR
jgi:hypothetical protein